VDGERGGMKEVRKTYCVRPLGKVLDDLPQYTAQGGGKKGRKGGILGASGVL